MIVQPTLLHEKITPQSKSNLQVNRWSKVIELDRFDNRFQYQIYENCNFRKPFKKKVDLSNRVRRNYSRIKIMCESLERSQILAKVDIWMFNIEQYA